MAMVVPRSHSVAAAMALLLIAGAVLLAQPRLSHADPDAPPGPDEVTDEQVLATCRALQRGQPFLQHYAFERLRVLGPRAHPLLSQAFFSSDATPEGRRLLAHIARLRPGEGAVPFLIEAAGHQNVGVPTRRVLCWSVGRQPGLPMGEALAGPIAVAWDESLRQRAEANGEWERIDATNSDTLPYTADAIDALCTLGGLIEAAGYVSDFDGASTALLAVTAASTDQSRNLTTAWRDVLGLLAWRWQVAALRSALNVAPARLAVYRSSTLARDLTAPVSSALNAYRNATMQLSALNDREFSKRERARRLLEDLTVDHPLIALVLLESRDVQQRRAAIGALISVAQQTDSVTDTRPFVDAAVRALGDWDEDVRVSAQALLTAIGPQDPLRFGAMLPLLPAQVRRELASLFTQLPDAATLADLAGRRERLARELPRLIYEYGLHDLRTAAAYNEWVEVLAQWETLDVTWRDFWTADNARFAPTQRSPLLRQLEAR